MSRRPMVDFTYGDHHCQPASLAPSPTALCMLCGAPLLMVAHAPGHTVNGRHCPWPETWRRCMWPAAQLEPAMRNPLLIPDFEVITR